MDIYSVYVSIVKLRKIGEDRGETCIGIMRKICILFIIMYGLFISDIHCSFTIFTFFGIFLNYILSVKIPSNVKVPNVKIVFTFPSCNISIIDYFF